MDSFSICELCGNLAVEAMELADTCPTYRSTGMADESPLGSVIFWSDVDAMWAAEMERRDRVAARPAGYREAVCEACSAALYVSDSHAGDLLCNGCRRLGEALADDGDDHPKPPTTGALHPEYATYVDIVKRWPDAILIAGIRLAYRGDPWGRPDQRHAWILAASRELLRRLETGQRAAA
jgi:hypothetical protein